MGIHDEDGAAVRPASDIGQIVSEYTPLRRSGRQWTGLCPFHTEKTPSFSVNPEMNVYYCFGCQAKGDVIGFVMEKEQVDFPTAVERLAARYGISLRYTDRSEGEGRRRRARLVDTMARAVEWYHQRLLSAPDAGPARRHHGPGRRVVRPAPAGGAGRRAGPSLPAGAGDRRRRRARVPARVGAGQLGCARARAAPRPGAGRGHGPRPLQPGPAARPLPG